MDIMNDYSSGGKDKNESDNDEYSTDCVCEYNYDPYCCMGTPYDNLCFAECDGVKNVEQKCTKGECENTPKPSLIPTDFPTIDCECDPTESDPVCCWGIEYINPCFAECVGISKPEQKCDAGKCNDDQGGCVCTRESDPLCCNGKDYANPCEAECDGITKPAEFYCQSGTC